MSKKNKTQKKPQPADLLPPDVNEDKSPESSETSVAEKRDYTPNPVVTEIPVACPRCKSTKRKTTKTTTFKHRPIEISGVTYPGRIVRRNTCLKCGRKYVSNAPYEPEPKPEPPKPCDLCDGRGMFPRDPKRKTKARICPACEGSGVETPDAET